MFRRLLIASTAMIAVTGCAMDTQIEQAKAEQRVDLLIVHGTVYRGDLSEPTITDVGISGDRIVFVGDATSADIRSDKTIDAQGLMVTPGLIDAHTHADQDLSAPAASTRLVARQIMQGVTTSIIGVDGAGTTDVKAELDRLEQSGIGQNVATYVGFGSIRERVLKEDARSPTAAELQTMKALAAKGMCEGAIGLSSGLFYAPQSFAKIEEVIAVAREAGLRGGLYDTHQRDEGDNSVGVIASLKEALRISRESGAPLNVGHIKVTGGPHRMSDLVDLIEAARASGQKVTADQYPWTAANTSLDAVVIPRWAQDGGRRAMLERFENPAAVKKIRAKTYLTSELAKAIMISSAPNQPEIVGKRLSDLAIQWNLTPIDAAIRILKNDDAGIVVFVINEADIITAMTKPWVMSSSDGSDGGHPRGYASFARLWENYVIAQKVITPVQFVHRSTGLEADTFGLVGRGYIKPGYFADIAVINPKEYRAHATYVEPMLLSTGVVDVVVNGQLELEDGKPTGILSGRALRKTPIAGTCP